MKPTTILHATVLLGSALCGVFTYAKEHGRPDAGHVSHVLSATGGEEAGLLGRAMALASPFYTKLTPLVRGGGASSSYCTLRPEGGKGACPAGSAPHDVLCCGCGENFFVADGGSCEACLVRECPAGQVLVGCGAGEAGSCVVEGEVVDGTLARSEVPDPEKLTTYVAFEEQQVIRNNAEAGVGENEMAEELVSVLMITHNRPLQVANTLIDLASQTHTNFELVVVDTSDKPLHETCGEECSMFLQYLKGLGRLVYAHFPDQGPWMTLGYKRSIAVALASGDVVSHWDDDDLNLPGRVEALARPVLDGESDISMFLFNYVFAASEGEIVCFTPDHHRNWTPNFATLTYRRSLVKGLEFPVYDQVNSGEDLFMGGRMKAAGASVKVMGGTASADGKEGVQVAYTRHNSNTWGWHENWLAEKNVVHDCEGSALFESRVARALAAQPKIEELNKEWKKGKLPTEPRFDTTVKGWVNTKQTMWMPNTYPLALLFLQWEVPGRSSPGVGMTLGGGVEQEFGSLTGRGFCGCDDNKEGRNMCPCKSHKEFEAALTKSGRKLGVSPISRALATCPAGKHMVNLYGYDRPTCADCATPAEGFFFSGGECETKTCKAHEEETCMPGQDLVGCGGDKMGHCRHPHCPVGTHRVHLYGYGGHTFSCVECAAPKPGFTFSGHECNVEPVEECPIGTHRVHLYGYGGHASTCVECAAPPQGSYWTGRGCEVESCAFAATLCGRGGVLMECGGTSRGYCAPPIPPVVRPCPVGSQRVNMYGYGGETSTCVPCQIRPGTLWAGHECATKPCPMDSCPIGTYLEGCGGTNLGACRPCENPLPRGGAYVSNGNVVGICEVAVPSSSPRPQPSEEPAASASAAVPVPSEEPGASASAAVPVPSEEPAPSTAATATPAEEASTAAAPGASTAPVQTNDPDTSATSAAEVQQTPAAEDDASASIFGGLASGDPGAVGSGTAIIVAIVAAIALAGFVMRRRRKHHTRLLQHRQRISGPRDAEIGAAAKKARNPLGAAAPRAGGDKGSGRRYSQGVNPMTALADWKAKRAQSKRDAFGPQTIVNNDPESTVPSLFRGPPTVEPAGVTVGLLAQASLRKKKAFAQMRPGSDKEMAPSQKPERRQSRLDSISNRVKATFGGKTGHARLVEDAAPTDDVALGQEGSGEQGSALTVDWAQTRQIATLSPRENLILASPGLPSAANLGRGRGRSRGGGFGGRGRRGRARGGRLTATRGARSAGPPTSGSV